VFPELLPPVVAPLVLESPELPAELPKEPPVAVEPPTPLVLLPELPALEQPMASVKAARIAGARM
jgi:hypothetical protein